jgi:hypothetical protein
LLHLHNTPPFFLQYSWCFAASDQNPFFLVIKRLKALGSVAMLISRNLL